MKALRIVFILLLVAAVSVAVMLRRSTPEIESISAAATSVPAPVMSIGVDEPPSLKANEAPLVVEKEVQPLEQRGDAMLFEIDALQHTPFDQSVTMPFE